MQKQIKKLHLHRLNLILQKKNTFSFRIHNIKMRTKTKKWREKNKYKQQLILIKLNIYIKHGNSYHIISYYN